PPQLGDHIEPAPGSRTNGFGPTLIVAVTRFVFGSILETVPSVRFGTQTEPSGAIAPSSGCVPTFTVARTLPVWGSGWSSSPSELLDTQSCEPVEANQTGMSWCTSIFVPRLVFGSIR